MNNSMLAAVPPMGWNSWNTFYDRFDECLIMEMADTFVRDGYLECGYNHLILDDCWLERERDGAGNLVPDRQKFPRGIEPVIDYVHSRGLRFGIYECCGVRTCAGYPGSFEHEKQDAELFARWGVDYLKYDNCHRPPSMGSELLYRRMSHALRSTGRNILLAACQWGHEDVGRWIRSTGAQTYRSATDIRDCWDSIRGILDQRLDRLDEGAPGCYNDLDMLVVGMGGISSNPETRAEGCTFDEYQTHFVLWAMLNSPLIIGCDPRKADERTRSLLQNRDIISINQDPEGRSCFRISCNCCPDTFALAKPLSGDAYAVGLFNFGENEAAAGFPFWELGLSARDGQSCRLYDCIRHAYAGEFAESYATKLPAHGCEVFLLQKA